MKKILEINDLKVEFSFSGVKLTAVNMVRLNINESEIVGLVGESGSGKTMTALSILNLIPYPGKIKSGNIIFEGSMDLLKIKQKEMRYIRGKKISLIMQDPLSSLNPAFPIGWQITEIVKSSKLNYSKKEIFELIIKTLESVHMSNSKEVIHQYPHQLSGGMRQRVIIAMSIILNPLLILADEPTTALDVTTQKEIFNLIEELRTNNNKSFLIISHDLYLIGERCDRVYVMYAGQIVENTSSYELFNNPLHPYTINLLKSTPSLIKNPERLEVITGEIPNLSNLPENGCFFQNRCNFVEDSCKKVMPELRIIPGNRMIRCHRV